MAEKIKTGVGRLLLVSKLKKSLILEKYCGKRPFLSSLPFSKFWKQNFIYFGHKHVETGPSFSHELATFLKYHMQVYKLGISELKKCVHMELKLKKKFICIFKCSIFSILLLGCKSLLLYVIR